MGGGGGGGVCGQRAAASPAFFLDFRLIPLPASDISPRRYVSEAFTLLYTLVLSLSCAQLFFLSPLSPFSLGIESQADLKTGAM